MFCEQSIFEILFLFCQARIILQTLRTMPFSLYLTPLSPLSFSSLFSQDFRYGNYNGQLESGTHAMEVITALIDGPLCFLVVFAAAHNYSWRHPLQIILCVMQMYGLLWFTLQPIYSETGLEGHFSSDPVSMCSVAVALCGNAMDVTDG